jgi:hypothetical protein
MAAIKAFWDGQTKTVKSIIILGGAAILELVLLSL